MVSRRKFMTGMAGAAKDLANAPTDSKNVLTDLAGGGGLGNEQ